MQMKYEYLLHTWGGFYNPQHKAVHEEESGYHYFDTAEERQAYLTKLRDISEKLNAKMLATDLSEGFHCRTITTLHRVTKHGDNLHYTTREMPPNYPHEVAVYHLEHKWYPGCNDYPMGEDFNYEDNGSYEIVQEWVTGAFTVEGD